MSYNLFKNMNDIRKKPLKFIDLYAGLGGFHQALSKLGHKGVWASEYNVNLRELYKKKGVCS